MLHKMRISTVRRAANVRPLRVAVAILSSFSLSGGCDDMGSSRADRRLDSAEIRFDSLEARVDRLESAILANSTADTALAIDSTALLP
jgi:hypothetical protein